MNPTSIVAYLTVFLCAGFLFVLGALGMGWLLRPRGRVPERLEPYECGELAVGSSFVRFDLRFYVVALVFLVFEVEVAFFFPWAEVFGTATQLVRICGRGGRISASGGESLVATAPRSEVVQTWQSDGVSGVASGWRPQAWKKEDIGSIQAAARRLGLAAMADMAVFFGVLLVGYAYVWSRGDLNWVRAVPRDEAGVTGQEASAVRAGGPF